MTRLDEVQAEIAYHKQILMVMLGIGVGTASWLFLNVESADPYYPLAAFVALVADSVGVAIFMRKVKNNIKLLRDL
jgi:hypothetical protein